MVNGNHETIVFQDNGAWGVYCLDCNREIDGCYFTEAAAEHIATEHNQVTVTVTREQFAILANAVRAAYLGTRDPAYLQLLNTGEFGV